METTKFLDTIENIGKDLGYDVKEDIDYDIENTATVTFSENKKVYLTVVEIYGGIENKINFYDANDKLILEDTIRGISFVQKNWQYLVDKVSKILNDNVKNILNTPEKVYDYGEENNWKGLEQKHYKILSQDKNLAQMAVADMQDKEIVIPDTLKQFRRYSMSFKDVVISKIANQKKTNERVVKDLNKKAAEEDLDVKLKVQKNKPAGLDTSSPKSLPESIRPLMQDLKGKISDVKEIETQLAARKAELDAKYQEAKNESKIVEKQAEIENLTNNIGKLLFAAKNETFQFQDNLVALTHQTKVVPAKATDKWKFEKVFEKLKSLMGNDNAQKFLDATLNGLQSQATEKTITELNIFSPTQKQMKTSDTSDTNKFIDTLKDIYMNLRSYFLDIKKANNILEEQLATGATASKATKVEKKAGESYGWVVTPEDAWDKLWLFVEAFGEREALEALARAMGDDELSDNLAYIFRMYDFQEGDSNYKEEEEEKEIESKKKVKVVKKANVDKKAENMVTMELPLANYMEMLKDRAKEIGRSLYMADELEDYFLTVGGNVLEPMIFVDNYLVNGEFIDKEEFTADGNYSELYEEYNGSWEKMCEEEAVFYNDEEACLNLGV